MERQRKSSNRRRGIEVEGRGKSEEVEKIRMRVERNCHLYV